MKNYNISNKSQNKIGYLDLFKVIRLKQQVWKNNFFSQFRWIKSNLSDYDIHIMLKVNSKLIAYSSLIKDKIYVDNSIIDCYIVSNVIVDINHRGMGFSSILLNSIDLKFNPKVPTIRPAPQPP